MRSVLKAEAGGAALRRCAKTKVSSDSARRRRGVVRMPSRLLPTLRPGVRDTQDKSSAHHMAQALLYTTSIPPAPPQKKHK